MRNPIGIGDASNNDTNQNTDWSLAAKRNIKFGIIRASTTGNWVAGKPQIIEDPMFQSNAQKMADAGVKRMSYHWFDPRFKVCNPIDQAQKFLDVVSKVGVGELGPMIDLEDAPAAGIYHFAGVGTYVKMWLDAVELVLKVKPRIYTNLNYASQYLFGNVKEPWLTDYGLVVASWGSNAPYVPPPWAPTAWDCWQYTAAAPGAYYGFPAAIPGKAAPNICLSVWNGPLPSETS